eukprot:Gb_13493 [translate_table: standard]
MGRVHLNLTYTMLPKTEAVKRSEESPIHVLGRSLSLKRANARAAKAYRSSQNSGDDGDQNVNCQHRFSKSIDELYVLSQIKENGVLHTLDWLNSRESFADDYRMGLREVGTQMVEEPDLWDPELASVSGYGNGAESQRFCIELEGYQHLSDHAANPKQLDEFGHVCCKDDLELPDCDIKEEIAVIEKRTIKERRRRRAVHTTSLSACLPSEINGSVKDSVALVKYSYNPYKDFRDSMLQMILIKHLDSPSDLEDLLYCYFSLNSPENYDFIKDAFRDLWIELESKEQSINKEVFRTSIGG